MFKQNNVCPICGSGKLKKSTVTETFEYKGQTIEIQDYVVFECSECNESIVDKKTLKKAEKILRDFHREVDGLLTSTEIKKIRVALGLTQKDFGLILGGGEKSFARYESCAVTQSKPMDNLIRIVNERPEVIGILQKDKGENNGGFNFSETFVYHYRQKNKPILKIVGE
jgi:HTH-type transcriptional regulator/antitoxin MqsA